MAPRHDIVKQSRKDRRIWGCFRIADNAVSVLVRVRRGRIIKGLRNERVPAQVLKIELFRGKGGSKTRAPLLGPAREDALEGRKYRSIWDDGNNVRHTVLNLTRYGAGSPMGNFRYSIGTSNVIMIPALKKRLCEPPTGSFSEI